MGYWLAAVLGALLMFIVAMFTMMEFIDRLQRKNRRIAELVRANEELERAYSRLLAEND